VLHSNEQISRVKVFLNFAGLSTGSMRAALQTGRGQLKLETCLQGLLFAFFRFQVYGCCAKSISRSYRKRPQNHKVRDFMVSGQSPIPPAILLPHRLPPPLSSGDKSPPFRARIDRAARSDGFPRPLRRSGWPPHRRRRRPRPHHPPTGGGDPRRPTGSHRPL
jgi:hypothetical protein